MPHLKISGISREELKKVSQDLRDIVVKETNTSADYVKIFYNPIEYLLGKEKEILIIEIYWMTRPQEICDKLAFEITKFFKDRDYNFIQVNYSEFPGNLFYENGVHY